MDTRTRAGFTLVEMLAVLAVVALLAALIVPAVGGAVEQARRATHLNNLGQIAGAYAAYALEGGTTGKTINADTFDAWATQLAQQRDLVEAELYVWADDPAVQRAGTALPKVVASPPAGGTGAWVTDAAFAAAPASVTVVAGLASASPPSSTPVAWTRGLTTAGVWNAADAASRPGVYGTDGGHIAFLDRHVRFFANLTDNGGQLIDATTRKPTADISKALNLGAKALDSEGTVFDNAPAAP